MRYRNGRTNTYAKQAKRRARFELLESRLCLSGTAEIHGMAYFGEGINAQPLAEVKIFLDDNENGSWEQDESWTLTNGDGEYSFVGLDADTYRVAEVVPDGYVLVDPVSGYHMLELSAEQIEENVNFEHDRIVSMVDVFIVTVRTSNLLLAV